MKRVNISLPEEMVSDLDSIAKMLGYSRAALISAVLHGMNLPEIRRILDLAANSDDDPDSIKRFRGESAEYIVNQLNRAMNPQGGLFDDPNG